MSQPANAARFYRKCSERRPILTHPRPTARFHAFTQDGFKLTRLEGAIEGSSGTRAHNPFDWPHVVLRPALTALHIKTLDYACFAASYLVRTSQYHLPKATEGWYAGDGQLLERFPWSQGSFDEALFISIFAHQFNLLFPIQMVS